MSQDRPTSFTVGRREFLQAAGAGIAAAGAMTAGQRAAAQTLAEKARFERFGNCSRRVRSRDSAARRPPPLPRRQRPAFLRIAIGRRPMR